MRQSEERAMSLESLANELLLDLFEFLSTGRLIRAFHGLNTHFNTLILTHLRVHGVDFRVSSKQDFDVVCREHLPLIVDDIISLCLSDQDETPQQIERFFAYGWNPNQFTRLRSLSLDHVCSEQTMIRFVLGCCHLTRLKLTNCSISYLHPDIFHLINGIWSLPKLIYFHFENVFNNTTYFPTPSVTSSCIEHLFIGGIQNRLSEMDYLFEHTPRLRELTAFLDLHSLDKYPPSAVFSITTLNIVFVHTQPQMIRNFLSQLPNLCQLTVQIEEICIDGLGWETIIVNYLPNLKLFRFKMQFQLRERNNLEQQVDTLIDSFRSHFWLDERRWFVRCHWNRSNWRAGICLYSLPYDFADFNVEYLLLSKSTCPDDDIHWSYNRVHNLNYKTFLTRDLTMSHIHFSNLRHLVLEQLVSDFSVIAPKIDRLTSLNIAVYDNKNAQSQLQYWLGRAPRLYSLTLDWWSPLELPLIQNTSHSVRRLDLPRADRWFDDLQCLALTRSPLGVQCEVLLINVQNRANILDLINNMNNLRALVVRSQDDTGHDELIQWLRRHLSPMCAIERDTCFVNLIRIWIG